MTAFNSNSVVHSFSAHSSKPKAWKHHVYVEWFTVLALSLCVLGAISLWSSYVYGGVLDRLSESDGGGSRNASVSIDKEALTSTLSHFERKRERYDALSASRPQFTDPSR